MRRLLAAMDLLVVLVFVAIGRSAHDHGAGAAGIASTMWPFAVGVGVGWVALLATHRSGATPLDGAIVTIAAVVVGMLLRVVAGQGTAPAFIVVAFVFLGGVMIGYRVALSRYRLTRSRGPAR